MFLSEDIFDFSLFWNEFFDNGKSYVKAMKQYDLLSVNEYYVFLFDNVDKIKSCCDFMDNVKALINNSDRYSKELVKLGKHELALFVSIKKYQLIKAFV